MSVVCQGLFSSHFGKKLGICRAIEVSILRSVTGGDFVISVISCSTWKLYWM